MGKTCLDKLSANVLVSCGIPTNGVKDLYLMHSEDVTMVRASDGIVSSVTFATGGRSYMIEGYKQNIQVTAAVRAMDASNKLDISVMFKIPRSVGGYTWGSPFVAALLNGKFVVLVEMNDLTAFMVGDVSPLECTGFDFDSNANGLMRTVTLSAPDGAAGNYITGVTSGVITEIKSKSV